MALPSDRTFDPPPLAEGTKLDPDATYTFDYSLRQYATWIAVRPGGDRRIVGYDLISSYARMPAKFPDCDIFFVYMRDTTRFNNLGVHHNLYSLSDQYLGYDWTFHTEPVNQWAYLHEWRADVSRFCHSFDALPGFESFRQLSAAAKIAAYQVGQTIGGHAWERLAFWLTYDAALSDDWKLPIVFDPVKKARDAACLECQSPEGGLHLALNINPTTFAAKLALGHIHGTNRAVKPWEPGDLLTVVTAPDEDTTVQTAIAALASAFHRGREYYLAHVAHEVPPHDH